MKDFIDYYEVLGVSPRASTELIKKAYRIAAKQSHPDTGGSESDFIILQTAYETLIDDTLRGRYDEIYKVAHSKEDREDINREQQDSGKQYQSDKSGTKSAADMHAESEPHAKIRKPIWKYVASGFVLLTIIAKIYSNVSDPDANDQMPTYNYELWNYHQVIDDEKSKTNKDENTFLIENSKDINQTGNTKEKALNNLSEEYSHGPYSFYVSDFYRIEQEQALGAKVWEIGSDIEILEFAKQEFQVWDDKLNEIYQILREQLPQNVFNSLRESQRQWIVTRDKIAEEAAFDFKGGSWEHAVYDTSRAEETRKRCYWLVTNYLVDE
ncbi:DnaJ domain-containing protein [Sporosarcina luteola]|uniref:lysozyme inhibitor LprI family protein n=1 Tax=Sporosarcina luteola TaxID=582850 RepID=UPI00203B72C8|nr:lysozyme inhibitor LprI family protein [Sporosarcina luteola]MCM3636369.1 DnaJ domain-containing protein [Sporosarcina luteola]